MPKTVRYHPGFSVRPRPGLGVRFHPGFSVRNHPGLRVRLIADYALTRKFPYEVLFVEDDERVVVLSVFHAKRNPKRWQDRI